MSPISSYFLLVPSGSGHKRLSSLNARLQSVLHSSSPT